MNVFYLNFFLKICGKQVFFKSNIYCVQISSNIEFKYTEKVKLFKE